MKGEPLIQDGDTLNRVCVDSGYVFPAGSQMWPWDTFPEHTGPAPSPRAGGRMAEPAVPPADALPGLLAPPFATGRETVGAFGRLVSRFLTDRQNPSDPPDLLKGGKHSQRSLRLPVPSWPHKNLLPNPWKMHFLW